MITLIGVCCRSQRKGEKYSCGGPVPLAGRGTAKSHALGAFFLTYQHRTSDHPCYLLKVEIVEAPTQEEMLRLGRGNGPTKPRPSSTGKCPSTQPTRSVAEFLRLFHPRPAVRQDNIEIKPVATSPLSSKGTASVRLVILTLSINFAYPFHQNSISARLPTSGTKSQTPQARPKTSVSLSAPAN